MPQATDWTEEMLAAAEAGGASNLLCPGCEGGQSRERSMSVFQSGSSMVAKCWRASCPRSYYRLEGFAAPARPQGPPLRPYDGELWPVELDTAAFMWDHYGISQHTLYRWGIGETTFKGVNCLAYPVMSASGIRRGWHLREVDQRRAGKMRRLFRDAQGPAQAFYTPQAGPVNGHVIVEDPISALRLWQLGYVGCCLIGNHISADRVEEQQQLHSGGWKLALDADAFGLACKYSCQWTYFQPVRLVKDFKDCTDAEIQERLR